MGALADLHSSRAYRAFCIFLWTQLTILCFWVHVSAFLTATSSSLGEVAMFSPSSYSAIYMAPTLTLLFKPPGFCLLAHLPAGLPTLITATYGLLYQPREAPFNSWPKGLSGAPSLSPWV